MTAPSREGVAPPGSDGAGETGSLSGPLLSELVEVLATANGPPLQNEAPQLGRHRLPHREGVAEALIGLRAALFPWHFGAADVSREGLTYYIGRTLQASLDRLSREIRNGLKVQCTHGRDHCEICARDAAACTRALAERLPAIRATLADDARAAYEDDPAATSPDEAVFCYPGMTAITHHRIAHELEVLRVPLVPRMIAELAHAATGIDIHPGAKIGARFFIDHGTGVVIGETCEIGEHVRLYQGVTLGARSFTLDARGNPVKGVPRHPIIEDHVVIYAGATVLGRIVVGKGSCIGGNVWLTHSVPPGSKISQAHAREEQFVAGAGI